MDNMISFIEANSIKDVKEFIENHDAKLARFYMKVSLEYRRKEIFLYLIEKVDDENFSIGMRDAMRDMDFFKSLILEHNLNPFIRNGLLFSISKTMSTSSSRLAFDYLLKYAKSKNRLINLNTEKDIAKLSDIYVTKAKDSYVLVIGYVYDPIIMTKYGFFPTTIDTNTYFIDYINGMDMDMIEFWYDINTREKLESLNFEPVWLYNTIETHKINGIKSAISLPLILYAPNLVYKNSKRPINDMSIFRSPVSNKISRKEIIKNVVTIDGEKWFVIPVTRYTEGMSKGLYFGGSNVDFCGTFYYYEPESTTLLAYKTSEVFFNKYEAIKKLNNNMPEFQLSVMNDLTNNINFMMFVNGNLPKDLMLTPNQYIEDFGFYKQRRTIEKVKKKKQIPFYVGSEIELYALEDDLDQPLCKLGKIHNLDIIILERMVGSRQIVTEILDTRNREDTFKSLIYVID